MSSCAAQGAQQKNKVCENSSCKKRCAIHWIYGSVPTGALEEALYENVRIHKQLSAGYQ